MSLMLIFHALTGTIAVIAGFTALFSSKGAKLHQSAGQVFFISMIICALAGAYIAFFKPQMITLVGGFFTCYLVTSSWMTIKNRKGLVGLIDYIFALASALISAACFYFAMEAQNSPDGLKDGFPAGPYFFFAGLAAFSTITDISVIIRKGLQGPQRIIRHVWRICVALFIAAGSLFTGPGAKVFPEVLRESGVLSIPELVVLLLMVYWIARLALNGRFRFGAKTA